jgi:hypothetical protein
MLKHFRQFFLQSSKLEKEETVDVKVLQRQQQQQQQRLKMCKLNPGKKKSLIKSSLFHRPSNWLLLIYCNHIYSSVKINRDDLPPERKKFLKFWDSIDEYFQKYADFSK